MLPGDDDGGHRVRAEVARLHEDRSVLAAARLEHRADARVVQYRLDLLRLGRPAAAAHRLGRRRRGGGGTCRRLPLGPNGSTRSSRMKVVIMGCARTIAPLSAPRIFSSESDDSPAMRIGVPTISPFVGGGPRVGIADHRCEARRRHLERVLLQLPTPAERPRFHVDVGESPRREMIPGPRRGAHERRRRGEARPDHGGESVDHRPGARVVQAFVADLREDGVGLL